MARSILYQMAQVVALFSHENLNLIYYVGNAQYEEIMASDASSFLCCQSNRNYDINIYFAEYSDNPR